MLLWTHLSRHIVLWSNSASYSPNSRPDLVCRLFVSLVRVRLLSWLVLVLDKILTWKKYKYLCQPTLELWYLLVNLHTLEHCRYLRSAVFLFLIACCEAHFYEGVVACRLRFLLYSVSSAETFVWTIQWVVQAVVFVVPLRTASSTIVTILSRSGIGISLPRWFPWGHWTFPAESGNKAVSVRDFSLRANSFV